MDERLLNDLLECSVCLERLDTSSKVLPCQHTFCRKCLEDIRAANSELRCPECRVLIDVKIDELPPNVLLMRILEGMKSTGVGGGSVPPKRHATPTHLATSFATPEPSARLCQTQAPPQPGAAVKIPSHPYARAVYDYISKEPGDLSFKKGDLIVLRKRIDNNWYHGECGVNQGVFPLSYVQVMSHLPPQPSHIPQCKALYDFRMSNEEEDGCLAFNKGEVITVIRRVDENWAEGKLGERIGIFPLAFVEMNHVARALMKFSVNAQPGPSRVAPPTPTAEDATPLIPTDHTRSLPLIAQPQTQPQVHNPPQQPQTQPQMQPQTQPQPQPVATPTTGSDSSTSTTLTSPSSSATSSSSPSAPSSPGSPPPPQPQPQPQPTQAPTPTQRAHHTTHHNRHSAEILSSNQDQPPSQDPAQTNGVDWERLKGRTEIPPPQGSPHSSLQLPAAYVALYPYKPQKADELELKRGSVYTVTERCQDGWFKGRASRGQKCGVFPGNYVAPAKSLSALQAQVRGLPLAQKSPPTPPTPLNPRPRTPVTYTRQSPQSLAGERVSQQLESSGSPAHLPQSPPVPSTNSGTGTPPAAMTRSADSKSKEKKSLMRRLTSMKKSRSPPPSYSMDNPVFEDGSASPATAQAHPVHVRSGSCPSQLLQALPLDGSSPHHRLRSRHKTRGERERGSGEVTPALSVTTVVNPALAQPHSQSQSHSHRKSNSLDGSERKSKQLVPPIRERFRCIAAYPANNEYELELRVGDLLYVHRKREDGWFKGTLQRTGRTGLFPASFVEGF